MIILPWNSIEERTPLMGKDCLVYLCVDEYLITAQNLRGAWIFSGKLGSAMCQQNDRWIYFEDIFVNEQKINMQDKMELSNLIIEQLTKKYIIKRK